MYMEIQFRLNPDEPFYKIIKFGDDAATIALSEFLEIMNHKYNIPFTLNGNFKKASFWNTKKSLREWGKTRLFVDVEKGKIEILE